jgi:polar amino acid transport system substrate-binding protein
MTTEKPSGILIDITNKIYAKDYDIEYIMQPWSRAIKNVSVGNIDALLGVAKNEAPNLVFPPSALFSQRFCFYTNVDDNWHYQGLTSLVNRTILYPQDALPSELIELPDSIKLIAMSYTNDLEQFIKFLKAGRTDTLLFVETSMQHHFSRSTSTKLKSAGCLLAQDIFLAFTPLSSENETLIKKIEHAMPLMIREGKIKALADKYTQTPIDNI